MSSINKHIILGRVGGDPEVRFTQSNVAVATLSVATSEKFTDKSGERQEKTAWHRVIFWGKLAEVVQKYVTKGQLLYVEGSSATREWEDKDGTKRYTTEVTAREMQMISSGSGGNSEGKPAARPTAKNEIPADFDDADDDLPF